MVKQKIVMKVSMEDLKKRSKALKSTVGSNGVISVKLEDDKIVVEGDGIDSVALTTTLRKRMGFAELVSVAAMDEKKEEKKEEKKADVQPSPYPAYIQLASYPQMLHQPYDPPSCSIM